MAASALSPTPASPERVWELLAQVSHDLRGPLTVIMGTAQLLAPSQPADADGVESILAASRKMLALLDGLSALTQAAVPGERPSAPPACEGVVYTTGLLTALEQAVGLVPARQSHLSDAPVVLRLAVRGLLDAARCTAAALAPFQEGGVPTAFAWREGGLRLCWQVPPAGRSGTDAPAQTPLETVLAAVGANLSVSGATLHGADLPQGGTEIALDWPATAATEAALGPTDLSTTEPVSAGPLSPSRPTIWLAEDHTEVRELLGRVLSDWDCVVHAMPHGQALIDRLASAEAPDLVVTDLTMPLADGHAVLGAVRARWPEVPVVLLSGSGVLAPGGFAQSSVRWFDAALTKPIHWPRLRDTLQRLLPVSPVSDELAPEAAAELGALQDLLAMGAVTDVLELAERVGGATAGAPGFWQEVQALSRSGDLDAIEARLRRRRATGF